MTFKSLRKLQEKFTENKKVPEFILITLEPEEDTAAALSKFKSKVTPPGAHWHFLRSDSDQATTAFVKGASLGDFWKMDEHTLHDFKISFFDPDSKTIKSLDYTHRDIASLFSK